MKTLRTRLLLLVLVAFLGAGLGLWYLTTDSFRLLIQSNLIARLSQATGLECRMRQFDIDVLRGTFRVVGFEMAAPPGFPRSLEVDVGEIQGTFRWVSFLSPKISLTQMNLRRPRLNFEFGKEASPFDPERLQRAIRTTLEVAAGQVTVEDGWVEVNNRRVPFELSLDDLICEIRYLVEPTAYHIRLGYRNGRAKWANRTFVYDLDTRVKLTMDGIDIDSFEVRREKTILRGEGWLRDWRAPVLLLHARGKLSGEELAVFHAALKDFKGDINLAGNFRWDETGFLSMGGFSMAPASFGVVVAERVQGGFELFGEELLLRETDIQIGTGKIRAEGFFRFGDGAGREQNQLQLAVQGLSLQRVAKLLNLPGFAFENLVDATGRARWRRGLEDLDVRGSARLHGMPQGDSVNGEKSTALEGSAEFEYKNGSWYIPRAILRSPKTEIEASGHEGSRFHLRMKTARLAEPISIVQNFSGRVAALLSEYPDLADVSGSYELNGDVSTDVSRKMTFEGQLHIAAGRWRAYGVDSLAAGVLFDGEQLELRSLKLQRGAESAEGFFALNLSAERDSIPDFAFRGCLREIDLTKLNEMGLDFQGRAEGLLTAAGSFSHKQGIASGEADFQIQNGMAYGELFDSVRGRIRLAEQQLRLSGCEVTRGGAKVLLEGTASLDSRQIDFRVRLEGFALKNFAPLRERKIDIDAVAAASGEIHGTFDNPSFQGTFDLEKLRYESWNLGQAGGTIDLKDKTLETAATVRSDLGSFKVQAAVSTAEGYQGKAHFDFRDWNARKIVTGEIPPYLNELSTALEGSLDVEGRFAEPSKLTARGEMDGARFKINDYELRNSGKIRFTLSGQRARVEEFRLVGEGSQLALSGTIPLDSTPGLALRLDGVLNLKALQAANTRLVANGTSNLNVRATGTIRNPQIIGQAILNNCRFDYGDSPLHFSSVQGDLTFSSHTVRVENVRGRVASGTFQVSGLLEHQNAEIRSINLEISARGARLPYPRDFRTTLDADLALRGSPDTQVLTGDLRVIRAEYIRDFNLLEQLTSRTITTPGPLVTDPILAGFRLDISVRSEDGLIIDNELLRLQGRILLTLRGTPAYPSLTGRVEATEGSIFFRGNRFEIIRAAADFVDRNRINPRFEVRAEADVRSYRLILDANGDLDNLRSNIRSDPPLATVDIVSLLATGKAREQGQSSRRQAEITGLSAASILSEGLTGVIGKRVGRIFGLESFRVDPFLAGVENDPTARVTISERLSKDLTITFSRNLSTDEEQIVVLEYDVTRNLSIIATRDEDGKFGVDFRFRKRFK